MNSRDFTIWLNGFFELTNAEELTKEQVAMIKEHLSLCFNKITPEIKQTETILTPHVIPNLDWTYDPKKLIC
jgi:hypothetical protein